TYGVDASSGADIRNRIPLLGDPRSLLPEAVAQLNIESVFLSPALFARDILNSPGQEPAVKAALQALPGPSAAARFAPAAYAMGEWQQPWVPLLLDWQVTVLQQPAYSDGQGQPTWTFNQGNWRFDGADFQWAGSTSATDFSESSQMTLTGRTFITPHLAFSLGDKLRKYVQTHRLRDPNLEKLLEDLEGFVEKITGQDILSQSLSGMLAMMVQRTFTQNVVPSGEITRVLGDTYHGYPLPWPNQHASYAPAVFDFAPLCGTFFVINKLTVIDAFGRTIDLMLANYSSYPHRGSDQKDYPQEDYFYPITGRNLKAPTALDPAPGRRKSTDPTQRMIQLTPGPVQDSQLCFRLISNDGQDSDISERAGASPICGWVLPNHLDRSLALYAPDGQAWGELYLSRQVGGTYDPAWQPDPTNPRAPQHVDDIPNEYVRAMMKALWDRKDNGKAFSDFLQVVDETLWTVNPLGDRNDRNLSVLVGRPLAVVRAELSLKLRGLPFYNQDWWNTFDMTKANPSDGTQPAPLGTIDGGMTGSSYYWPVRLGSRALRDDGLIGYFAVPWDRQADHPPAPADTYRVFNTVTLPAGLKTDYLKQIGQDNYLLLRAVDDTVTAPDPDRNQVARLTLLVDPRAGVHAFTGLLPVVKLDVQSQFITPALQTMAYTFRAGPILTARDAIRVPRPAEDKGTWSWFDRVLNAATPLTPADANARISPTASQGKEGWLKFTPNPSEDGR
ncbi:MAG: hypothetical protein JOZ41_02010, partial [Chloroflexi bacterium]|nr:hypothetical protein [Chloroflexota bacterium]